MEKTSREYAEKLADEYCSSDVENFDSATLWTVKTESENFVKIYLKAVEETNVKELRDALEKSYDFMKVIYKNLPIEMHNMNIDKYKRLFEDYLVIQSNNENALNKTKS